MTTHPGDPRRDRSSLTYRVGYAVRNPDRIPAYLRRVRRDALLRLKYRDHASYYRAVMKADAAVDPKGAIGSHTDKSWKRVGKMQFDYLVQHGLRPEHRMLEIGCGNLRAGWRFIDYLDTGNYYGIDLSPDILLAAQETLQQFDLQPKLPHLTVVRDLRFAFLPDDAFDVVHAHSVFSHCPVEVIEECFAHVGRVLRADGWFDFTFDRTEGREHHVLHEDYYYRTETLVALAAKHGLAARFMDDWEQLPHKQSKIRVRHA